MYVLFRPPRWASLADRDSNIPISWNALGPVDQIGPYGDSLTTYLGDYHSAIVLGFTVP
jgi:hypothetical protein